MPKSIGMDRQPSSAPVAEFHEVDLADTDSIMETAAELEDPIDALFNVAGVSGPIGAKVVIGINFVGNARADRGVATADGGRLLDRDDLVTRRLAVSGSPRTVRGAAWQPRPARRLWPGATRMRSRWAPGTRSPKDTLLWYTLTKAVELAARGIRINAVAPGITSTPIIADTIRSRGKAFLDAIPMPLGRVADPREQATVIAFLGSSDASYLSGQIMWVDGGYYAGVAAGQIENVTGSVG